MDAILAALNSALSFTYDNILSIAMMLLLILAGIYLSARTRFFQFRKFGTVMKSTVGSLFDKSNHAKDTGAVSPFQAVTTALAGISTTLTVPNALWRSRVRRLISAEPITIF